MDPDRRRCSTRSDDDFKTAAVEAIDKSGQLDPEPGHDDLPRRQRAQRTTVRVTRRTP